MDHFLITAASLGVIVLPCGLLYLCLPPRDGRDL